MRRVARSGITWSASGNSYRRGERINGWMIAFATAPQNSVISPTLLPGAGNIGAAKACFT
jgi:hypothetical protein